MPVQGCTLPYCMRRRMVFSHRLFGTTCVPRLEGSSSLSFFLDCLTLEDGTDRLFRKSVRTHHYTPRTVKSQKSSALTPRQKPENRLLFQFSLCHGDCTPYSCCKMYKSFISPQSPAKFYLSFFASRHSEEAGSTSVGRLAARFKRD